VSGPRRAALGLGLVAAAMAALVAVRWPVARPVPAAPAPGPAQGTAERPTGEPSAPVARRRASASPSAGDEAVPPQASPGPARRACPDLDAAIDELAGLLVRTELQVVQVFDPRAELLGEALDQHCAGLLVARAADPAAPAAARLAALSLLRVAPRLPDGFGLSGDQRALLWRSFDRGLPSPVQPTGGLARSGTVAAHRDAIARVAGACLAVLGDAGDLHRLLDRIVDEDDLVAARSFAYARTPQATGLLVDGLSETEHATQVLTALLWILESGGDGAALEPELVDQVAGAVAQRWRTQEPGSNEELMCSIVLAQLDPELAADRWAELLDANQVPPARLGRAALALARSSSPEAAARLGSWLAQGAEPERLAAAVALLRGTPDGEEGAELQGRAAGALESVLRTSADPGLRRTALYALERADPDRQLALAVEALALDGDDGVRIAAVHCLQAARQRGSPQAQTLLERAALEDASQAVRRAAEQALR